MHVQTLAALTFDRLAIVRTDLSAEDIPYWLLTEAVAFEADYGGTKALVPIAGAEIPTRFRRPSWDALIIDPDDCPSTFGAYPRCLTIHHDRLLMHARYTVVGPPAAFNPHFNEPSSLPTGGTDQ